jgi:hypothetical protein
LHAIEPIVRTRGGQYVRLAYPEGLDFSFLTVIPKAISLLAAGESRPCVAGAESVLFCAS